jgi:large subunit ribosomal protein L1
VLEEVERAKPSTAKGRYFRRITVASTMGPGVKIDPNRMYAVVEETVDA